MGHSGDTNAELRFRIRQQEVVADLGQRALNAEDLDRLFQEATAAVAETLDAEYCKVLELRPGREELLLRAGVGWRDGAVGTATVPTERDSQAGYTLLSEEPVIVADLRSEERFSGPELLTSHGAVSGISVVIGSVDDPWGVLGVHTTDEREFTAHDANFVQSIANVLGSAIENHETNRDLELFRTLLNRSTDSVLVVDPETGRFLDVNETACRRRGYSREELLELTVPDVETEIPDREAWREFVEDLKTEGETTFDGVHRRKDGSTFPVELNATGVELDREYVIAVARDVTERRERQRELEQYRALTQAANDVIVTIDEESTVRSVNPTVEDVFGYDQEELVDESLTALMPEGYGEKHREAIERYLRTGEKHLDWDYVEIPGLRADGHEIALAVSFSEVEFDDERFFTGILRDITERKEIQRELEESNERLEQFAYAASHDLKEPLRMVSSYLSLIERRYDEELDEEGREFLAFAVDGATRMQEMIDGLLEYARVETRGEPFEPVDLEDVRADVLADLQVRIEETGAEVTADPLPVVEGDPSQLRQLFQNLLSNAIEYSGDEPPRVHLSAERRGAEWAVSVADEGIGIDPDDQERIFEVFQRLGAPSDDGGTGIGLALCRRIVERHGGVISVESGPGEGTTFTVTLPAPDGAGR